MALRMKAQDAHDLRQHGVVVVRERRAFTKATNGCINQRALARSEEGFVRQTPDDVVKAARKFIPRSTRVIPIAVVTA